jgi:hypothetical protein
MSPYTSHLGILFDLIILRTAGYHSHFRAAQPLSPGTGRNGLATYFPFFCSLGRGGLVQNCQLHWKYCLEVPQEESSWELDNSRNVSLVAQAH